MKKILLVLGMLIVMVGCSSHKSSMTKEEMGNVGFMIVNGLEGDYYNCTIGEKDYTPKEKKYLDIHNIDCSNGKKNDPEHIDFFEKLEKYVRNKNIQISNTYAVEAVMMVQNYMEDHFPMILSREKAYTIYFVFSDTKDNLSAYDKGEKTVTKTEITSENTSNVDSSVTEEIPEGFDTGSDEENLWRNYIEILSVDVLEEEDNGDTIPVS